MNAALLLALFSSPAHAWKHTGYVWTEENIPLEWYLSDKVDDSIAFSEVQPTLEQSYNNWIDVATCAQLGESYQGLREGYDGGAKSDGLITFQMADDTLPSEALGVTTSFTSGELAYTFEGQAYYYFYDADIGFNPDYRWATSEQIEQGNCSDQDSLESVATHEIGHMWGLGHSCDKEDVEAAECEDSDLRAATMFWQTGPCNLDQASIETDDLDGINALYGPYCTFSASDDSIRYGGTPLTVCFDVTCTEDPQNVEWDFGDGQTPPSLEPCHTYEDKGQFSVSMTTTGAASECGEWSNTKRERAYVLVCAEPEPAEGFDGLFTFEHYDGLIYQMVNQTDTSVYGCVDRIEWDVFKGDQLVNSVSAWSPKIEFPSEGTYKVVLNVGGPGGVSAASLEIDAVDKPGEGTKACSTVPVGTGLLGLFLGLGAVALRRRDDD